MASDLELVIGARNDAADVLAEIGEQLQALSIPAREVIFETDKALQAMLAGLTRAAVATSGVLGAVGLGVAAIATAEAIKSVVDESNALESLNRHLDNYAGHLRVSTDEHEAFAASIRRSLGISEAQTLGLLEQASVLGVSQDRLQDAATAAIGLSTALGIDLSDALKKVVDGDENLVSMVDSVNNGLQEQSQSLSGLAGVWNLVATTASQSLKLIIDATQPIQDAFAALGVYIKDAFVTGIVSAVSVVQVFQENTSQSLEAMSTLWQLFYIGIIEESKHAFTVAMPAYVMWFTTNFTNFFTDAISFIGTALSNFAAATSELFKRLWEFIASGGRGGLEALAWDIGASIDVLIQGFEAKTSGLPDIIDREITGKEASLLGKMATLGNSLGKTFSERFQENLKAMQIDTPSVTQSQLDGLKSTSEQAKQNAAAKTLQAEQGRLLTRGRTEDIQAKQLKQQEMMASHLRQIDANTRMSKQPPLKLEVVG